MTKLQHRKIWQHPWSYKESFIIAIGFFIVGTAIDFTTKTAFPKPAFPWNISAAILLVSVLIIMHLYKKESHLTRWLSSIPAAIGAITFFTFISVLMGLMPQKVTNIPSFSNLLDSWAYLFAYVYLLIVLGLSAIKRTIPLKRKNGAYLLNHWGLWIALVAAGFGAGEIQKYSMYLTEGKTTWYAYNPNKQTIELPFALKLDDFVLENYPARIALIDINTRNIIQQNGKPVIADLPIDKNITMRGRSITTNKFIPLSLPDIAKDYHVSADTGAVQAALITVGDVQGWVSPGNFFAPMAILPVDNNTAIAMLKPEAKRYASYVSVFTSDKKHYDTVIEVNKPLSISGWKIYQSDYDAQFGQWSRHSILDIVKDPWLPIVFAGLYMMVLGSFWLILQGKTRKKNK